MKSADVKPVTTSKSGPGKPFFTGAGRAVQELVGRPAFFNPGKGKPIQAKLSTIQAKLSIGKAADSYEKEADKTADKVVMRLAQPTAPVNPVVRAEHAAPSAPPVQTKCAQCEHKEKLEKEKEKEAPEKQKIRKKPIFDSNAEPPPAGDDDANIRRCAACDAEAEQKIQRSPSDNVESRLNSSKGGGRPLPDGTRQQMESSMGADFSKVRLHTDNAAAAMSKSLHAHAFTHGSDIYFNTGKYNPENKEGQHLLAHELTHTIQQGSAPIHRKEENTPAPAPTTSSPSEPIRAEAKADAGKVRDIFVNNSYLGSRNQRDIMAICRRWADKPLSISVRLSTFDHFVVALRARTFHIGHVVEQTTSAFDQIFHRMDNDNLEQFRTWMKDRANVFKDEKAIDEVHFEVTKQDVVEGVELAGNVAAAGVEVAGAGLSGGASELLILGTWLATTLPKLLSSIQSIYNLVESIRNLKGDDIKKLFSAKGFADVLVKALFGEIQQLPVPQSDEKEEAENKEGTEEKGQKGFVKLLNRVSGVIKTLVKAYGKVAGFINNILSTVNITTREWFDPFAMAYAGIAKIVEIIQDPDSAINKAIDALRGVVSSFFEKMKGKFNEITGAVKDRIVAFTDPAAMLKKISDKAVEWVMNFIISNPPSPLFKLLAKAVEQISGKSLVEILREKVKFADDIIKKIANSETIQKLISPLKGPVSRITGFVDTVVGKAGSFVDNMQARILSFLSSGGTFLKQLIGHKAPEAKAESKGGEAKKAEGAKENDGDFLGTVESGIHSRLVTIGSQLLAEKAAATGKSLLEKGKEKVKALLLGPKVEFTVNKKHHELWVEQQGDEANVYVASKPKTVAEIIKFYEDRLIHLPDSEEKRVGVALISDLKKTYANVLDAAKSDSKKRSEEKMKSLEANKKVTVGVIEKLFHLKNIDGIEGAEGRDVTVAPGEKTEDLRQKPGTAWSSEKLDSVKGKLVTKDKVGRFPGQIARIIDKRQFKSFRDFRQTFWKLVTVDDDLNKGWTDEGLTLMKRGLAPFAKGNEGVGGGSNAKIQLNHILALERGGQLYDMANLELISPKLHGDIDPRKKSEDE